VVCVDFREDGGEKQREDEEDWKKIIRYLYDKGREI
jgi:hypothetical protein